MQTEMVESAVPQDPAPEAFPSPAGSPERTGFPWPEWTALSLFAAIVAYAIPFHEPWSDEAQAWQLARSLSFSNLFRTYVRYEASPGLWHALLWILARSHVSYSGLHWFCAAIAVTAASLLIFKSPLPRYLKLTLPFSYFLLFQYAVIARGYVLVPLILFLLALRWKRSTVQVALLLGLLANVSLHAAVISGGLAIVYLIGQLRRDEARTAPGRRRLAVCAAIVLAFYALAIWTAWPPHDLLLAHFRGQSRPFFPNALGSVALGISQPWPLSVVFWIAIAFCLRARRALLYLLPVLFFAGFSGAVYAQFWHMGLLVPLVICIVWITWPAQETPASAYERAGRFALLFLAGFQILWSGYALRYDHFKAYSGDLAAAQFLKPLVEQKTPILLTWVDEPDAHAFDAVGILPYFTGSIFANQAEPFWWWSENNPIEARFADLLPSHPPVVLVEYRLLNPNQPIDLSQPKFVLLAQAGYRFTNSFCGTMPERMDLGITSCHLIFQYTH
jgi:hypothetical protein